MAAATLTSRFSEALVLASFLHRTDRRKGTPVPYVAHLLGVCDLVLTDGGDEDEAIAALLHDAIEDHGDKLTREDVEGRFGTRVRQIVEACTDTPTEYVAGEKPPWRQRKEPYVRHIREAAAGELRVALADKVYNARSIVADARCVGADAVFARFNAPKHDQKWYYRALVDAFRDAGCRGPLFDELGRAVSALEQL